MLQCSEPGTAMMECDQAGPDPRACTTPRRPRQLRLRPDRAARRQARAPTVEAALEALARMTHRGGWPPTASAAMAAACCSTTGTLPARAGEGRLRAGLTSSPPGWCSCRTMTPTPRVAATPCARRWPRCSWRSPAGASVPVDAGACGATARQHAAHRTGVRRAADRRRRRAADARNLPPALFSPVAAPPSACRTCRRSTSSACPRTASASLKGMVLPSRLPQLYPDLQRPELEKQRRRVPPALLDQHVLALVAGAAVPHARPQRRDQHHRRQPRVGAGARARGAASTSTRANSTW